MLESVVRPLETMKRFLCIHRSPKDSAPVSGVEVAKLIDEMTMAGVLLARERCMDSSQGARVCFVAGEVTTLEGPFREARAFVTSVYLLQVSSRADAVEWNKRILTTLGEGENEILELYPIHSA